MLELLGQKKFDDLKALLGDKFNSLTSLFKADVGGEEDNIEKGEEDNVDSGVDTSKGEELDDKTDDIEDKTDDAIDDTTIDTTVEGVVLAEGWLKEDGTVDIEKILDESLKGYIEGLNKKIADIDQDMLKALIEGEAKSQGMVDITDIVKFVDLSSTTKENVSEVVGNLKKEKGYLFNQKPVNEGFNPSKQQVKSKYKEGMSFSDAMALTED